jgi:hypothetical protein
MNSHGASLASDSAVTFSDDRTYNNVNKIFPLGGEGSKHQIAFMICGGARYLPTGMLWERVIGLFYEECVKHHHPSDFDTVENYVEQFQDFLKDKHNLPDAAPSNGVEAQDSLKDWFLAMRPVERKMKDENIRKNFIKAAQIDYDSLGIVLPSEENIEDFLDAWEDIITNIHNDHNTNEWQQRFLRVDEHHNENSKSIASKIVDDLDLKPKRARKDLLRRIFNLHLAMTYNNQASWVDGTTTIAVVGFGALDFEPRMFELNSGIISDPEYGCVTTVAKFVIRNRTTREDHRDHQIRCVDCGKSLSQFGWPECPDHGHQEFKLHSAPAFLKPFAMASEIQNTLNGLHADLRYIYDPHSRDLYRGEIDFPKNSAKVLTSGIVGDLRDVSGIGPDTHKNVQEAFKWSIQNNIEHSIRKVLFEHAHTYGEVVRRQKFRSVVMGLPIADLSAFARTLVNLQASINYYMESVRSVGGDIDLASITKEYGFQWID